MMLLLGSIAVVGLSTMIKAQVCLSKPSNLVIVSVVMVFSIGNLALILEGFTLTRGFYSERY